MEYDIMKWFVLFGILAILPLAYSYTPDSYTDIQTTLQGDYTPDDYRNIITILDKSTADTTAPIISIQSPINTTYNSSVWFNITADETLSSAWFSLDSGANVTMTNSSGNWNYQNTTMANGAHTVRFYANDTSGNINSSIINSVSFYVGSCSCPSLNTNWAIALSDYCIISTTCNIGTGNITFSGTGNVTFNASIITKNMGAMPANQKGYIGSNARIRVG